MVIKLYEQMKLEIEYKLVSLLDNNIKRTELKTNVTYKKT